MARVIVGPLEGETVGAIVDRLRTMADELEAGAFEAGEGWELVDDRDALELVADPDYCEHGRLLGDDCPRCDAAGETRAWSDGLMGDVD